MSQPYQAAAPAGPPGSLLQEAQEEISSLRNELYSTRRAHFETQQGLNQALAERDGLVGRVRDLEQSVSQLQQQTHKAASLERLNSELEERVTGFEGQLQQAQEAAGAARRQVEAEQAARQRAEDAKARLDADRARLQRSRDEYATSLRVAQARLEEVEEEQLRAEQLAAAAAAELRAYQSSRQPDASTPAQANGGQEAGQADVVALVRQVEVERSRAEVLVPALNAAKGAAASAKADLEAARERIFHLEQQAAEHSCQLESCAQRMHQLEAAAASAAGTGGGAGQAPPRPASMQNLVSGPPSMRSEGGGDDDEAARQLHARLAAFKASRDKLLAEVDAQSAEIERLSNENTALCAGLEECREAADRWEAQAQQGLAQAERLKDLLEESAAWPSGGPVAAGEGGEAATPQAAAQRMAAAVQQLEAQLLGERARAADLDAQVRALCMELTRSAEANGDLGRAILPALNGIEGHLSQVLRMAPSKAV